MLIRPSPLCVAFSVEYLGDRWAQPGKTNSAGELMHLRLVLLLTLFLTAGFASAQAVLNQKDTFQDGTNMDWSGGASPTNISTGGPDGVGDRYLQISRTNGFLATYNMTRWSGNYTALGITRMEADLKSTGTTSLVIRMVLFAADGSRWSSSSIAFVQAGAPWMHVGFDLKEENFIRTLGSATFANTMANMERIMFRHEPVVMSGGTSVTGTLGIDNVHAPIPAQSFDFTLNKSEVAGQNFVQGTVTLPQNAVAPVVATITDSTSLITTPATVTVPTGSASKTFGIQTAAVNFPVSATVSAKIGTITVTRNLTLIALIPTALAFNPNPVIGGNAVTCRVVVNGVAGPSGRTIAVFDNSAFTTMPSTVIVPPGGTEVAFQITTVPVTSTKLVTVTARVTQGEKTATFRINP